MKTISFYLRRRVIQAGFVLHLAVTMLCFQAAGFDGQKRFAEDTKAMLELQKAYQQSVTNLQQARAVAFKKAAIRQGLPTVQSNFNSARVELERVTKDQNKRLKEHEDYQAAVKAAEAASEQLKALRDDKGDEARRKQADVQGKTLRVPGELLQAKLATNEVILAARAKLSAAQTELTKLQRQVATTVQQDAGVVEATKKSKEAEDKLAKAKKDLEQFKKALDDASRGPGGGGGGGFGGGGGGGGRAINPSVPPVPAPKK